MGYASAAGKLMRWSRRCGSTRGLCQPSTWTPAYFPTSRAPWLELEAEAQGVLEDSPAMVGELNGLLAATRAEVRTMVEGGARRARVGVQALRVRWVWLGMGLGVRGRCGRFWNGC